MSAVRSEVEELREKITKLEVNCFNLNYLYPSLLEIFSGIKKVPIPSGIKYV